MAASTVPNNKAPPSKDGKTLEDVGLSNLRGQAARERLARYKELKDTIKKYSIFGYDKEGKKIVGYTAERYAYEIKQAIFEINYLISEIGAPFGGAGDTAWFAEARMGWRQIYSSMASFADTLESLLEIKNLESNIIDSENDVELLNQIKSENTTMEEIIAIVDKVKRNRKVNPVAIARTLIERRQIERSKMEIVRSFFDFYNNEFLGWAQFMYDLCWDKEHTKLEWAVTIYQPPSMPMGREPAGLGELGDPNANTYG